MVGQLYLPLKDLVFLLQSNQLPSSVVFHVIRKHKTSLTSSVQTGDPRRRLVFPRLERLLKGEEDELEEDLEEDEEGSNCLGLWND